MEDMIDRERLVEILRAIKEDIEKPLYMDNLSDITESLRCKAGNGVYAALSETPVKPCYAP